MGIKMSVDFGTSNTVVSVWDEATRRPRSLHLPEISRIVSCLDREMYVIPSLIHFDAAGRSTIGDAVVARKLETSKATFRRLKSRIRDGHPANVLIHGKRTTYQEAAGQFLKEVLRHAVAELGESPDIVAVSVPVDSFEAYNRWISEAVVTGGDRTYRVVDEPVAAAIGYGARAAGTRPWMIFDLGGGTLDVAVVLFDGERDEVPACRVLGKHGIDLGGEDMDDWLADEVMKRHNEKTDSSSFEDLKRLVVKECRLAKEKLSTRNEASVMVVNPFTGKVLSESFTRAGFEELLARRHVFKRVDSVIDAALRMAEGKGYTVSDIARVVMVGGGSFIPSLQAHLRGRFGNLVLLESPLDAVANGACILLSGCECIDFITHCYAVKAVNAATGLHEYHVIVPAGTPYPNAAVLAERKITATRDGQERLGLEIYEVSPAGDGGGISGGNGSNAAAVRKRFSEQQLKSMEHRFVNRDQATFLIAEPPARRGDFRFKVEFSLDEYRRLVITSYDLATGRTLHQFHPVVKLR